jgi:S-adenosyl-L-methionine hydrolase (adenosine-forming)
VALVTLLTDFGGADGYVGAMKGVIQRLAPGTTVIDLAHDVPRHDVAHAAWVLTTSAWEFPEGTIHVVVVDPGVGGARAEVIVAAGGHLFVGPDNGVFGHVAAAGDSAWGIPPPAGASPTFHGRDVFAPTAAALARGAGPETLGAAILLRGRLPWPDPGVIVHVDVFGNLISDVRWEPGAAGTVRIAGLTLAVVRTYEDVAPGEPLAYVGSAGTIEIAVRERDAARVLGIARGEPVEVTTA